MAAVEAVLEILCFQFGECFRQKELIRNTGVLKKDGNFLPALASQLIFHLLPFVLESRHGSTESFILVVSSLNARSDQ